MIGLIDYGSGNINAIANIYQRLNINFVQSRDIDVLSKADKLVLPGVGAFDETMRLMSSLGLVDPLNDLVLNRKVPILGVCVGMQILGESSDEGDLPGFGWIKGKVKKLEEAPIQHKPRLPHMGWNTIEIKKQTGLLEGIEHDLGFYFLHNYYFECESVDDIVATTEYGLVIHSAVNSGNVYGVQFHPEKSHSNGIKVFTNFANLI